MAKDNVPWEEAIQRIMRDAKGALHYSEIAERIVSQGLRTSVGATPAATVSSYLSTSLKDKGRKSPYLRVGRGEYTLRELADEEATSAALSTPESDDETQTGALRSFGMYWRREAVVWKPVRPKLWGRQQEGASRVNFADQVGIYLLHDRDRVIYVGRATDGLCTRLRAHTSDRLGGRWDRFSWFGLFGVNTEGKLQDNTAPWTQTVVIDTMEALLIESLEPPLNRKRGDNFSGVEYVQVEDPEVEKEKAKRLLATMADKL